MVKFIIDIIKCPIIILIINRIDNDKIVKINLFISIILIIIIIFIEVLFGDIFINKILNLLFIE